MSSSFDAQFSYHEPLSCKTPLVGGNSVTNREQVSRPSPSSFDDSDEIPDADDITFFADDDSRWDVFLPDDDEIDPLPELGDFWFDDD